jgi:hypothetical protein
VKCMCLTSLIEVRSLPDDFGIDFKLASEAFERGRGAGCNLPRAYIRLYRNEKRATEET